VSDNWIRSTRCNGDTCVEIAFRKSTRSGPWTDNCVEVANRDYGVQVRDSKDPQGPVLSFTHAEWDAFLAGARDGEFDL
jgi:hypothetical protein